ncbi:iron uptake system component EfeO [Streptosporangium becharense]|uniref:Iron uptake system component EfeO n=1 Tax=Streptosporangium becharense TaxID=1816182 RepID=A0A7W9IDE0_9ACTN|nr:iron uptake system protein EfeO [Streptosporangium becharense]MBB2912111.1 iron uptake system component EfeO [Streptosporangium becharense]MBB5818658.1 iron uptake system component EfeO [Streptosporangium becharense]
MSPTTRALATCGVLALAITACSSADDGADGGSASGSGSAAVAPQAAPTGAVTETVDVAATDTTCVAAKTALPAGVVGFKLKNDGKEPTWLYLYRADKTVVGERANIAPGASGDLVVELPAGTYQLACKPNHEGDGIRQEITVSGELAAQTDPRVTRAVDEYRAYVETQVDDTIAKTEDFVAAVKKGDVKKAKALYAPSRVGWERIEPVAEAFGDIDPKVDLREADLEDGQKWTGWHRLEKALWEAPKTVKKEAEYGDVLLADLDALKKRLPTAEITASSMANGAKELLDEVATGKVTGEEEAFSHTDLWDFKANVNGAFKVYQLLTPIVMERNPGLVTTLDTEFAELDALLAKYGKGDGFVSYTELSKEQVKELADAVNALAEPLSGLAAVAAG